MGSLPLAIGVALSPFPVTAVIIILMSARARTHAPAFVLGWIAGILTVGIITFVIPGIDTERGEPTVLSGWLMIVLGTLLLFLSVRQWVQRPAPNKQVEPPKFLASLDQNSVHKLLVTGFLLSAATPKNFLLTTAGAARIDASMLGPGAQAIVLMVFAAVGSLGVGLPVVAIFLGRRRATSVLGRLKDWLIRNNVTMIILLLLVFGVVLISRGKAILGTFAG